MRARRRLNHEIPFRERHTQRCAALHGIHAMRRPCEDGANVRRKLRLESNSEGARSTPSNRVSSPSGVYRKWKLR